MAKCQSPSSLLQTLAWQVTVHLWVTLSSSSSEDSRAHSEKQEREARVNVDALSSHAGFF